jgi:ATP-dependent Clp protease protease subunit
MGERAFDIYSRLLRERIVFWELPSMIRSLIRSLPNSSDLEAEDPEKDIQLYINSPGGSVYAGLAIYDTMQQIRPHVATICFGLAASMGAFLLCGGAGGKRMSLPSSRIMIHQPSAAPKVKLVISPSKPKRSSILNRDSIPCWLTTPVNPTDRIANDTERDFFMSAVEAKEYGLIDQVISRPELPDPDRSRYFPCK